VKLRMDSRIVTGQNCYAESLRLEGISNRSPRSRAPTWHPWATEVDWVLNNRHGFDDGTHLGPIPAKGVTFPLTLLGRADEVIE
jgi:hypothetical protein